MACMQLLLCHPVGQFQCSLESNASDLPNCEHEQVCQFMISADSSMDQASVKLVRLRQPNTMQCIHVLCNVYVQSKDAGATANRRICQQDLLLQSI